MPGAEAAVDDEPVSEWPSDGFSTARVLRLAALFGLVTGALWGLRFGWRGVALGGVGAVAVVATAMVAKRFGWRVALVAFTLVMFLTLMFGASRALGPYEP